MINKFRSLARKIYDNGRRIEEIERNLAEIKNLQQENYWANIFNSAISGSTWFKDVPINVGRWAPSYVLFYVLYRVLNETRPMKILELGMGETTKMFQKYKEAFNPEAICVTVEHDKKWIELKQKNGLTSELINVVNAELGEIQVSGKITKQYLNLTKLLAPISTKYNLIVIDGPFGSVNFSRYNIVDLIRDDLLGDDFIIMMDDYNRNGERETIDVLRALFMEKKINFNERIYSGDKDSIILVSENYKFLTSL